MSDEVFPAMPGLAWNVTRSPEFNTKAFRSVSGKEVRAAFMAYPLWNYKLGFEFLRQGQGFSELEQLTGFFLSRKGAFDSFRYTDPDFNSVTDQQFGWGDGVTTQFQLLRSTSGFLEPIQNVNALASIKKDGAATTAYTINSTGLVTFTTAPTLGQALTWTGTYYIRCRFAQDLAEFNKFMDGLHDLKTLKMVGAPGNKV